MSTLQARNVGFVFSAAPLNPSAGHRVLIYLSPDESSVRWTCKVHYQVMRYLHGEV